MSRVYDDDDLPNTNMICLVFGILGLVFGGAILLFFLFGYDTVHAENLPQVFRLAQNRLLGVLFGVILAGVGLWLVCKKGKR